MSHLHQFQGSWGILQSNSYRPVLLKLFFQNSLFNFVSKKGPPKHCAIYPFVILSWGVKILLKSLEQNPQPPSGRNYEFNVGIQVFPYHVPKFFNSTKWFIFIPWNYTESILLKLRSIEIDIEKINFNLWLTLYTSQLNLLINRSNFHII